MNIFLNIIILASPNYDKLNIPGTTIKSISIVDQLIYFYKSLKKNLTEIKYDITIVHFKEFNANDKIKLEKLDINIVKIKTNDIKICAYSRFNIKTRIKGTHRLIAETDMLLLKNPQFNWDMDFQAMYGNNILYPQEIIDQLCDKFNLTKIDKAKFNLKNINNPKFNNDLIYNRYNIFKNDRDNLFPYFNNGLILIKEDFSHTYHKYIVNNNIVNAENLDFIKNDSNYVHFVYQLLSGLILNTLTSKWEPFARGTNYLIKSLDINKFGKENIILLHYCGGRGYTIAKKYFPEYFC